MYVFFFSPQTLLTLDLVLFFHATHVLLLYTKLSALFLLSSNSLVFCGDIAGARSCLFIAFIDRNALENCVSVNHVKNYNMFCILRITFVDVIYCDKILSSSHLKYGQYFLKAFHKMETLKPCQSN